MVSDGFVVRYDHDNELAAIGCRNGDRLVYDVAERNSLFIQIKSCRSLIAQIKTLLLLLSGDLWSIRHSKL